MSGVFLFPGHFLPLDGGGEGGGEIPDQSLSFDGSGRERLNEMLFPLTKGGEGVVKKVKT